MKLLLKVWNFLLAPDGARWNPISTSLKTRIILAYLGLGLGMSIVLGMIVQIILENFQIKLGQHAMETYIETRTPMAFFLSVSVMAPLLEETLFRGPLGWFKDHLYFKYILYASIIAFAGVHLSNFQWGSEVVFLAPLLIAPQVALGAILSFIRIRLGLLWAIGLHAAYNTVLVIPILIQNSANFPLK